MEVEQRQHNRIDVTWKGRLLKEGHTVAPCRIENVSIGGVFLRAIQALNARDIVLVEIHVGDETPPRQIICKCEIMRVVPAPDFQHFAYGLRFQNIKDDDFEYLLNLIARRWTLTTT